MIDGKESLASAVKAFLKKNKSRCHNAAISNDQRANSATW